MRMKGISFLVFSGLFLILATSLLVGSDVLRQNPEVRNAIVKAKGTNAISYTPHTPIVITGDTDFISQGWTGYGNETHPYLIEGLEIASDGTCIDISGTTVWFAVINCNLTKTSGYMGNAGVSLESLENAAVSNCTIKSMYLGIYCEYVQNTVIRNNTMSTPSSGIDIRNSERVSVFYNTGHVDISYSTDCHVDKNKGGVRLNWSRNCSITDSDFGYGKVGLSFDGVDIEDYIHNISGNTVQGFPVVYMRDVSDQLVNPTGFGQLILVNCTRVEVLNGITPAVGYVFWITAAFCNQCSIKDNSIQGCSIGITLMECPNTHFEGNVIDNASQTGMHVLYSRNCTLVNNEIRNCYEALRLGESHNSTLVRNIAETCTTGFVIDSENCTVIGNEARDCVAQGFEVSDWNIVKDNVVSNVSRGSEPSYTSTGITVWGSNTHLENNTIENASGMGISLGGANCTLIDNTLVGRGLFLSGDTYWHWIHTMSGNTLDGEPLLYVRDQVGGSIDAAGYGQVIVANCSGIEITDGVFEEVLAIGYCYQILLENNTCFGTTCGYILQDLINSSITRNTAFSSHSAGFLIKSLMNCTIENNVADSCGEVGFGIFECYNCTVLENAASKSQNGMEIGNGVDLRLDSNQVFSNDNYGLYVWFSEGGLIVNNRILNNEVIGIYVQGSSDFVLYGNEIGYNGLNAYEIGVQNQWDNGVDTGNAWSDYNGTGSYTILGDTGSQDRYPTLLNYSTTTTPTTTSVVPSIPVELMIGVALLGVVVVAVTVVFIRPRWH